MLVCSVHRPPATVSLVLGTTEGGGGGTRREEIILVVRNRCYTS